MCRQVRELLQRSDVKEWINKRLKGNVRRHQYRCPCFVVNDRLCCDSMEVVSSMRHAMVVTGISWSSSWSQELSLTSLWKMYIFTIVLGVYISVDTSCSQDLYNYPLNIAFKMGHFSVVEVFIEMELKGQLSYQVRYIQLHQEFIFSCIHLNQHRNGRSLLHVACDACHVDTKLVRRLLDAGLDGTKLDKVWW